MKRFVAIAMIVAAAPFAASAQSGQITVPFNANYGPGDYWCAAGNYVARLGASATTPIYVVSPLPRPRGEGMTFSLTGPSSGHRSGLVGLLLSRTDVLRAHAARGFCSSPSNSNDDSPREEGGDRDGPPTGGDNGPPTGSDN